MEVSSRSFLVPSERLCAAMFTSARLKGFISPLRYFLIYFSSFCQKQQQCCSDRELQLMCVNSAAVSLMMRCYSEARLKRWKFSLKAALFSVPAADEDPLKEKCGEEFKLSQMKTFEWRRSEPEQNLVYCTNRRGSFSIQTQREELVPVGQHMSDAALYLYFC